MRVEGVHPREIQDSVLFGLVVTKADAGILRLKTVLGNVSIFDVVRQRIVRNLVIVPPNGTDYAELIGGIDIEDKGPEAADTVCGVMHDLRDGRLQAEIGSIAVDRSVIGEPLGVATKIELVVGLMEVAGTEDEFRLVVAFETCSGHNVEDPVGAVAEFGAVAAAIGLQVIN